MSDKAVNPMTPEQWAGLKYSYGVLSSSASSAPSNEYSSLAQHLVALFPAILAHREQVEAELDKMFDLRGLDSDIIADLKEQLKEMRAAAKAIIQQWDTKFISGAIGPQIERLRAAAEGKCD